MQFAQIDRWIDGEIEITRMTLLKSREKNNIQFSKSKDRRKKDRKIDIQI